MMDFSLMIVLTMYILTYSNPLLSEKMKKVFWSFPEKPEELDDMSDGSDEDSKERAQKVVDNYQRLEPEVAKQAEWLMDPTPLTKEKVYTQESSNFPEVSLSKE